MKFILENIEIRNFKGLKEQDIEFDPIATNICGGNATGKTTVVDAFTWLLFEKDSKGRTQFEIKTLENGEPLHGLDHSVEGMFKIDGRQLKLKKIYKEVWTKQRGDNHETFTGHEIERFINDIPVKKTEYQQKIGQMIDEKVFQLLTDPLYFSQQLGWKERRGTLFELAGGDINKEDVFKINEELRLIQEDLEDKTIEELKKSLSYQRRELNKKRENIPVKIETLNSTMKEIDVRILDAKKRTITDRIDEIENEMLDATKLGEEQLKKQDRLYLLKSRQKEIEYEVKDGLKDPDEAIKREIKTLLNEIEQQEPQTKYLIRETERLKDVIDRTEYELKGLREEYTQEAAKKIEIATEIEECPTCKRAFPADEVQSKISELEENFKEHQVRELKRLRDRGTKMSEDVEYQKEKLEQTKKDLDEIQSTMESKAVEVRKLEGKLGSEPGVDIATILNDNEEYQATLEEIEERTEELRSVDQNETLKELRTKKRNLEQELKEIEKELNQEDINLETKNKINELMEEEKTLSQQIGDVEQKEYIADRFIITKAELIERSISEKFEKVTFRLFKKQTNGGLDPTCDVLVDGVPFDNANTAGQVNAGLDVINSLCKHYNTYTPIFIDNRESINDLIDTDSQLVNLKVTRHKALRIEIEN